MEQDKFKFLREDAPWMDAVHAILGEDCKLHYMGCMLSQVGVWVCMLVCACVWRWAAAVLFILNVCVRAVVVICEFVCVRVRMRDCMCCWLPFSAASSFSSAPTRGGSDSCACLLLCASARYPPLPWLLAVAGVCVL